MWLVADAGVEGEGSEEFIGSGGDDSHVEVFDEHDDVGSGVGSADADVGLMSLAFMACAVAAGV